MMKRHATLLLCFALIIFSGAIPPQKFEGKISYRLSYLKIPEEIAGMESMLPQSMELAISKEKMRIQQDVMGGEQIVLVDLNANTSDILMDMMGQKIHIHVSAEEMKKAQEESTPPTIKYLDGTKKVVGYHCKKAEVTDGEGNVTNIWYTNKIQAKHKEFQELDGFPLEYETWKDEMHLRVTADKVEKTAIPADYFSIPSGYTTMTMDELNESLGK